MFVKFVSSSVQYEGRGCIEDMDSGVEGVDELVRVEG